MNSATLTAIGRLARRTARRNWKRTILIVLLVAVPVAASQLAAGMVKASRIAPSEYATQQLGAADMQLQLYAPTDASMEWVEAQLETLAPDADALSYRIAYGAIPGATRFVEMMDLDATAPLAEGKLGLVEGRLPQNLGEVALSDGLVELTGATVGDVVEIESEQAGASDRFTVVGTVRDVLYKGQSVALISSEDMDTIYARPNNQPEWSGRGAVWLISTQNPSGLQAGLLNHWEQEGSSAFRPEPAVWPKPEALASVADELYISLTASQIAELEAFAATLEVPGLDDPLNATEHALNDEAYRLLDEAPPAYPELLIATEAEFRSSISPTDTVLQAPAVTGAVIAALLMAEVALVAGAAYATGIRRRLREVGLLSVNGATGQHIRWIVLGEGLVAGLLGAVLGSVMALGVMSAGRPIVQQFVDRFVSGFPLGVAELLAPALVGVAAATIAAWIPARSAAAVPAVTALEGRMPLASPRRWVVPLGVGVAAFGAFLLVVAKTSFSDSGTYQAGLGVALMIGGFALMAGPMIAWMGDRADRFPILFRLVIRDSARQRTRAATAIAATMVVLVAPVAAGAAILTSETRDLVYGLPENPAHVLIAGTSGYELPPTDDVDPEQVALVEQILPSATTYALDVYPTTSTIGGVVTQRTGFGPSDTLAPEAITVARGSEELLRALGGGAAADAFAQSGAVVLGVEHRAIPVGVAGTTTEVTEVPAHVLRWGFPRLFVSDDVAARWEMGEPMSAAVVINDSALTEKQRIAISDTVRSARVAWTTPFSATQIFWMIGGAALLVVLLIVALVTALAATESDHDLRAMVAVGAAPRIRRRFLGLQTLYYTLFAAALAAPLALLLLRVSNSETWVSVGPFGTVDASTVVTPWLMIAIVVVGIPLVVGLLTAVFVRSAPTVPPRRIG